jgi:hypothetical protein
MDTTTNYGNDTFSNKNANFQTMNMVYKIKKIKKKRKQPVNMKNMEFPEVLSNINEPEPEPVTNGKPIIEGMRRFEFDKNNDWDGNDNINDDKKGLKSGDPRQIIISIINYIYDTTVALNKQLAHTITDKLSNNAELRKQNQSLQEKMNPSSKYKIDTNKQQENDELVLYNQICIMEAFIFSCFVVNNWYYLMYYNNFVEDKDKKVKLFDFSVARIKCLNEDYLVNKFLKYIVLFFLEYALVFPEKLQWFLTDAYPKFTSKFLNHTIAYMVLFFVIFYYSYNFASGFKTFLIDCVNLNSNNRTVAAMYLAVIILYIMDMAAEEKEPNCDDSETMSGGGIFDTDYHHYFEGGDPDTENFGGQGSDQPNKIQQPLKKDGEEKKETNNTNNNNTNNNNNNNNLFPELNIPNPLKYASNAASAAKNAAKDFANNTRDTVSGAAAEWKKKREEALKKDAEERAAKEQAKKEAKEAKMKARMQKLANAVPKTKKEAFFLVLKIIWAFLRFCIIISISVPVGGVMCGVYFVLYSLFGMLFYNDWDAVKVSEVFKTMLKFIDDTKVTLNLKEGQSPTFSQLFVQKLNQYFEYFSDQFFIILLFAIFINFLTDTAKNVSSSNSTFKNILCFIDISAIVIIFMTLLYIIKAKFKLSSLGDAGQLIKNLYNSVPVEKDYEFSTSAFYLLNSVVFAGTLGTIGYLLYIIIKDNNR